MSRYSIASLGRPSSALGRSSLIYVPHTRRLSNVSLGATSALYSGTLSWECALADVVGVLKIQYRNDAAVCDFLSDHEKVRQLTYSSIARAEYNRRCIREELDFEMYSPPRARRIAKDVAIDYIRKYLDGEEDKILFNRKILDITTERDAVIEQVTTVELENNELKREKDKLLLENCDIADQKANVENKFLETSTKLESTEKSLEEHVLSKKDLQLTLDSTEKQLECSKNDNEQLRSEIASLKADIQQSKQDNDNLRAECQDAWKLSSERRDEIGNLKAALETSRAQAATAQEISIQYKNKNQELTDKNNNLRDKNLSLRDENNVYRSREEEMRTLVNIQANILSVEKTQSDLKGVVRLVKSPQGRVSSNIKAPDTVPEELDSSDCESEEN